MIIPSTALTAWMLMLAVFFAPILQHTGSTNNPSAVSKLPEPLASSSISAASQSAVIVMDRSRTKSDIVAMAKKLTHSGFTYEKITAYNESPSLTSPYKTGSLNADSISDALNTIKMVRYLAGLPYENVKLTSKLNNISQHGAVLLAATKQFTHTPSKPEDMDSVFYDLAYKGCSEANLYRGHTNISSAILGFIADPGDINIGEVGHRRWLLKPGGDNFGIGYADKVTSLYIHDGGSYETDTYVAWPGSGDFPIEYFVNSSDISTVPAFAWSVNLGAAYNAPVRDNITLTLIRIRDNKSWVFDRNTPQLGKGNMPDGSMHFAVDNSKYGMGKAILFRPDLTTLGPILESDEFTVQIDGLTSADGASAQLRYNIRFFGLQDELEADTDCKYTQNEIVKNTSFSDAEISMVPCYVDESGKPVAVKMSMVEKDTIIFAAPKTASYYYRNNAKNFTDTASHWASEHITFVTSREIFSGIGGNRFDPDGTMTRAMFVTVLARLSGADETVYKGSCTFSDVKSGEWFEWAVAWAAQNGIVTGAGNNLFCPDVPATREQMASLIVRYAAVSGYGLSSFKEESMFTDDENISSWSKEAVYSLRKAGVINGKPGNLYDPGGQLTRAEASVALRNFIEGALIARADSGSGF